MYHKLIHRDLNRGKLRVKEIMARVNLRCLVLAYAMVMILLVSEIEAEKEEECKGNHDELLLQCKFYIVKPGPVIDPSKECCVQFQNADIPCVCRMFTRHKEIEKYLSIEKWVYVAKYCQCPLESGSKCGSKLSDTFSSVFPLDTGLKCLLMLHVLFSGYTVPKA